MNKVDPEDYLFDNEARYSCHSMGNRYFFLLLHSLQAGTIFPFLLFPPLLRGSRWSIVRLDLPTSLLQ